MPTLWYLLLALACPVGMGLMMWMMMGMNKRQEMGGLRTPTDDAPATSPTGEATSDERLAQLRAQLGEVQAQQAAIVARIAQLSAEEQPTESGDADRSGPIEPTPPPTRRPG
jgi:hypothetical protein